MSTVQSASPLHVVRGTIAVGWRQNRPLTLLVLAMAVMFFIALAGLLLDPRMITGAPAWLKPAKFAFSFAAYGATLAWLLTFLHERPRLGAIVSWGILLGLAIEIVLISLQVVRGTTSHFNAATPFDDRVFNIMGIAIAGVWLLTALIAALLFRRRFASPPVIWGVRLGLVTGLLGMALAFLMTAPTPEQTALLAAAGSSPVIGAHTVGAVDGGPGLPILGWSTTGGDLRVPHFIGLHALQMLPLLGVALSRFGPAWLSMRDRARLVGVAGAAWIALTLLLTWQALRAQSVIAPDELTLAVLGAIVVVGSSVIALILVHARSDAKAVEHRHMVRRQAPRVPAPR